jgi:type II secretory pathway pseudopilin PulG
MIVIAIIGILSAALFPHVTGYIMRARDAARQSDINNISLALTSYYTDRETYPNHES